MAIATKVEVVDSLGPFFGTCAVSNVEQAGAQKGFGGGFFSSTNPGLDMEIAALAAQGSSGDLRTDSARDVRQSQATHDGDLRMSEVAGDGVDMSIGDGDDLRTDSTRDLRQSQATHDGDLTVSEVAGEGVGMHTGHTPQSGSSRDQRRSISQENEEEADIEGNQIYSVNSCAKNFNLKNVLPSPTTTTTTTTCTSTTTDTTAITKTNPSHFPFANPLGYAEEFEGGDDDEEGLEGSSAAVLEELGIDQEEIEAQLNEYANELSG